MKQIMKPYIIGETAYNHEGDIKYLFRMIEEIADLKLDAVKFHMLLDITTYFQKKHPLLPTLQKFMFTEDQWTQIFQKSKDLNLDVINLCDDVKSIEYCLEHEDLVDAIELHATGLNDYFQLTALKNWKKLVILGVGGSTLDEIRYALEILSKNGNENILLMYGFQSYPTDYGKINLSKMLKIGDLFERPLGYADHTGFDDSNNEVVSVMAASLGVPVLEKHFTCDEGKERVDYHAAVGKETMQRIKELMNLALSVYGTGDMNMSDAELKYGNTGPMKKALVAGKPISRGSEIRVEDVRFKRTEEESTLKQNQLFRIIGLKAKEDIAEDEIIDFTKVEYEFQAPDPESFTHIKKEKGEESR